MIRNLIVAAVLACLAIEGVSARTDEERLAQIVANAEAVVVTFGSVGDKATLVGADGQVERAWRDLYNAYGEAHPLAPQLALIRARTATARADRRRIIPAWHLALKLNSVNITPALLMSLNIEAGHAASVAGDTEAVTQFFAAARAYAFVRGSDTEATRLLLRLQEVQLIAGSLSWRELRDTIAEMRSQSEAFSMWSVPRLEALVGEAEVRLAYQPPKEHKREDLSDLKASIELAMKGLTGKIPVSLKARIRQLYYALEDDLQL